MRYDMHRTRAFRHISLTALFGAMALGALGRPSFALPEGAEKLAAQHPIVQSIARKGTRNYVPDSGSGTPDTTSETAKSDPAADAKALQDCIAIWDEKTHISPSNWKEICKRQLKERGAQLR